MKIIAEIGVNFQSDIGALEMLAMCGDIGIKYAKFELFEKDKVPKEIKHCFIDKARAKKFYNAGKKKGIEVFFTIFYPGAIDICEEIGVKCYKIRYMDRNNLILYRRLKKIENIKDKIIFVSCQDPKDTIFRNIARYQGNIRFLYCVPKYPARFGDYFKPNMYFKDIVGISDHTPDFDLFEDVKMIMDWFELHVKLNDDCLEAKWSKSFEQLKDELKIKKKEG